MHKRLLLSGLVMLLVLGLIACGGPAATPAPEEAEEAPAAEEEEQVELRFWMHQNAAFIAANEELIRRFEAEHPNVTIKLESFEYDLFIQTLQTSMPAGTEADIMEMFGTWVCSYADGGRLAEMPESIISRAEAEDLFFAAPLQGYDCSGKLYGLPNEFNIENGAALVSPALFEAAGVAYPPDWGDDMDAFLADAQNLTQFDGDVMTVAGLHFVTGDGLAFQLLAGILQRGGEYWKPDGSGLQLDTPEARETLEWMKSMVDDYKVVDPFLFNDDSNWVGDAFFSGQTAIGFVGPWAAAEGLTEYPDMEFDYVAIPWVGEVPYFAADSGWGKVVSVNSEHKDIAWEFAKFATANADSAKVWNVNTGTIPALKSVTDDPTLLDDLPWIAADLPLLQYGRYIGPLPDRDLFWYDITYPHILGVLQDIETIDEALAAMDAEANAMFE
jgi:multiple sugar transport system substrate-binding protein